MPGPNTPRQVPPEALAEGFLGWNVNPYLATAAAAPSNQEVQAVGIYLDFNVPVTGLILNVSAIVGTITGFFVGLGNATTLLVKSGNLNASGSLAALGRQKFAFTAPYTPKSSDSETGYFYAIFLMDTATLLQFNRTGGIQAPASGHAITAGRAGTAQTGLPVVGATYSSALAAAGGQNWFVGAY